MKKIIGSFKKILHYLNIILSPQNKIRAGYVVIITFVSAVLQTLGISVIIPLMSAFTEPDILFSNKYVGYLCTLCNIKETNQLLVLFCIITIFIYIIKNSFCIFTFWIQADLSAKLSHEISIEIYNRYRDKSYDFIVNQGTALFIRNVRGDADAVKTFVEGIYKILAEALTAILIVVFIIVTDWKLAILMAAVSLACIYFFTFITRSIVKKYGEEFRSKQIDSDKILMDFSGGIKEIKVLGIQDTFLKQYSYKFTQYLNAYKIYSVISSSPTYIVEMMFMVALMGFIVISILLTNAVTIKIPILASFALAAIRMLPSIGRISSNINGITFNMPGVNNVCETLQNKVTGNKDERDDLLKISFNEELRLENVYWSYPNSDINILSDFSLNIKKGNTVGIIGKSGAGKTTLIDIILGLHIPQKGVVKIDGMNLLSGGYDWKGIIGYVPQNIYIFDRSVRENIAIGIDSDSVNDDEIWDVLEKSQLSEYVRSMENGLDTMLGERGIRFSGGQRQRLAIARALYRKPQILIMDEATSALDNDTEEAVMEAVDNLHGSLTMIIVAHRLSTLKGCDEIYEIKNGKANKRDKKDYLCYSSE